MNKDQTKDRINDVKSKGKTPTGKVLNNKSSESAHDTIWRKYGGAFRQSVSSHL